MPDRAPMTRLSEAVVHATALVHAVDGAEMLLRDGQGRMLSVGRHPSADVDACRWHRFVAAGRTLPPDVGATTVESVSGRLRARGGGVFADRTDASQRWFVAALCPGATVAALRGLDLGPVPDDAVTATVRPDPALGVTVVGLRVLAPCFHDGLDRLGLAAVAACLTAELVASVLADERQS